MYRRSPSPRTAPLRAAVLLLIALGAIAFGAARHVARGTDARAQFFRSTLARIVAGGHSAETKAAPDVVVAGDRDSRWTASAIILFGLICAFIAWRVAHRVT